MTKADARKALSTLKKALNAADPAITSARIAVESLEARQGIILAKVAEVLGSRKDLPNFKAWVEKEYSGRSYGTLNRWKQAGQVAIALGFSETSKDVPPVMELAPLAGLDDDVVQALYKKSEKGKGTRANRIATLAAAEKGTTPPKQRNNTPTAPADSAGTVTVEYDAAELEARTSECRKALENMNRQIVADSKKEGWTFGPAAILKVRGQTLRLVQAHGEDIVGIVLGSKSSK